MGVAIQYDHHYTVEEFFDLLAREPELKAEYHNGNIRLMAGGTGPHSKIKFDTGLFLGNKTIGTECEPFNSDMAVRVEAYNSYLFPDLHFVCGEPRFEDEAERKLLNACLFFEVISDTGEAYDRGDQFQKYRSIESFREYVLIDSKKYSVEVFYQEEPSLWRINSADKLEESVRIHTLGIDLPLSEVYRRVRFEEEEQTEAEPA